MSWAAILFGLIFAGFLAPFIRELRKPVVNDKVRAEVPGKSVRLSQGTTHCRWLNDKVRGPVAVCVHGLTTPSFVWDGIADRLDQLGYRVLVYDLYGRGLSDRPAAPQTRDFFVRQLSDLIAHEKIEGDITLIGYSMGGQIATCYAAEHPDMLRRLVLIAPAGVARLGGTVNRVAAGLPVLGDWLFRVVFPIRHRKAATRLRDDQGAPADVAAAQAAQLDWRGFVPSVLSSLRRMIPEVLEDEHRRIGAAGVPVLAIWAERDESIPLSGMGLLANWNREAEQAQIPGASHWVTITHPQEVVTAFRKAVHG
ncbi:hypothetical protein ATO6_01260 [Oceanicola sp. 22II-s10i]|uniref:alpha/beta fold hydrolase n=1 Tax=Oceanicola sp. 22II-s10i TaxID=1317116 RepID=UPI000B5231CC|nr:alpha/beta hydrolase [Oceanicola sp. 22II-s10i]OWU86705.1 hypothetical protein ATO6_01260 [Oceanicola sp. 22II-s10i]